MSVSPTEITRQPGQVVGPYRLLRRLGAGGMGEVWEARDERLDRIVALKLLLVEQEPDPQVAARTLQEGRALAQLDHPCIVRVYHCERMDQGGVYLAMELIHGASLSDWLERNGGRLEWPIAVCIGQQIATAMAYVHGRNIIHRDLKPDNILIIPSVDQVSELRVKLIDFGIAKVPAASQLVDTQLETATVPLLGTPLYMAPEQFRNPAQTTGAADVYALGVLLFEAIAGRPPFIGEPVEVLAQHIGTPSPPLRDFARDAPAALCALVASMLDKDPANRPNMQRTAAVLAAGFTGQAPDTCPLPGLMPFSAQQAEWFLGRREELRELGSRWQEALRGDRRWIQVEGPSGTGKTSLVQAGLIPCIVTAPDQPDVLIVTLRPSGNPVEKLRESMHAALTQQGISFKRDALDAALGAAGALFNDFVASHLPAGSLVLVIIEQLEELLTLGNAEHFDAIIADWLNDPASRVRVISTFRSDFLHRIEQLPGLARILNHAARYHLRAMDDQSLVQVIEGMAQRSGLRLADGLAERMTRDAGQSEARLSLIGHALQTLWLSQKGDTISHADYEGMHGVIGALTTQIERLLDELGPNGRERAKWIVLGLIQPGHGSPDTRRPRMCSDLLGMAGDDRDAEQTLHLLAGLTGRGSGPPLRLIALHGTPGAPLPKQQAELVHEMLITQVPAIGRWLEEERALLARCSDLEGAAAAWDRAGRPKRGLPAGTLLQHLSGQSTKQNMIRRMISERASSFLATANRLDSQRRWLVRAVVVALVYAAIFSALSARNARQKERSAEESSHRLATAVRQVASNTDWELARAPGTLNARRELLSVLIHELTSLPEGARSSHETTLALVEAHHRRGDLALANETLANADAHFSMAQSLLPSPAPGQPEIADVKLLRALNLSKRGKVALAREDFASARGLFTGSVAILEAVAALDSSDEAMRCLAISYGELASALAVIGHHADATRLHARAAELLVKNTDRYDQWLLAGNQIEAAEVALAEGSISQAERLIDHARKIIEAVPIRTKQTDLFADTITARMFSASGDLASRQGKVELADELLTKATAIGLATTSADPTNKSGSLHLAQTLARSEAIALKKADQERALELHDTRCRIVAGALSIDAEDARFRRLACKK